MKVLIIHQLECIYNRIENRITLKIKSGYYLELLTPETMKLLGSTECKIIKDKNGENVPHLEIVELVLVNCNLVNNDYQQDSTNIVYFCSKQNIWLFIRNFTNKSSFFKNI